MDGSVDSVGPGESRSRRGRLTVLSKWMGLLLQVQCSRWVSWDPTTEDSSGSPVGTERVSGDPIPRDPQSGRGESK